ncbi:acyltransferase [Halococcus hamelinensis]|uniref:Acetyltransferase-like protein n=1 Tax=Halococcus hamelinensis 100A6 TaxID=1132509 RepID=M0LSJ8_9EURY|nr:acyltransferase [Halococcus hamelinensis]EMA36507.1 acetyltransferase-like protein [Halococcus hamelinensis 100A6]
MTKRHVTLPPAADAGLETFLTEVDDRLSGPEDTCDVVAETLAGLYGDDDAYRRFREDGAVSAAERVRLQGYDPCNATLESEYYAEKDEETFERSKHLQWLWRQFDATPMADNVEFALRFRAMLANHLFAEAGENLRLFKGITMTYGHNIEMGDNTVVHDDVHLDDRGRLTVGSRVSIADDSHVYSHDHDIVDQTEITNFHTLIADDARLGYDSMVRAGVRVGENAMVGARSLLQRDVPDHHVAVGTPAKSVRVKPGWESVADPIENANEDRRDERRLATDLPEDLDEFDEFGRDRSPPT